MAWKAVTDPTFASLTAIRHWRNIEELVQFALDRRGFGDTNGGFGILYPSDLDEYEKKTEGLNVPEGFVLAYGFGGSPDGYELLVPEWLYRDVLAEVLECLELWRQAAKVRMPEGWLGSV